MTKYFQLIITIVALVHFATNLHAQVTIGSDTDPQSFSVLELDATTTGLGLRLPQVETTAQLNAIAASLGAQNDAKGLMVMNLEDKCLYVYDGLKWIVECGKDPQATTFDASKTAAILYGYNPDDKYNRGYGIDVSLQNSNQQANLSALKVTWTNGHGQTLPAYSSEPVHGLTIAYDEKKLQTSGGTIDLNLSGIPTKRGAFDIPFVILGQTYYARIHVGCGMYQGSYADPNNYLLMMCINWGVSESMDWSANPFRPDKGCNGDYFQWGRKSPIADANTPAEYNSIPADNPLYYGQINTNCYNFGSETYPIKNSINDPCPEGWRMPTHTEIVICIHNVECTAQNAAQTGIWNSDPENYSAAFLAVPLGFPKSFYTIAFPASGFLSEDGLASRGILGRYITTSEAGCSKIYRPEEKAMKFDIWQYSIDTDETCKYTGGNPVSRRLGMSIRCVQI